MTKKLGLTLEQHQELGHRLHAIRNQIGTEVCLIGNAYPRVQVNTLVAKLMKAQRLLDEVRSNLDSQVFEEFPELDLEQKCSVYYPG
jgi:hypothetical protein